AAGGILVYLLGRLLGFSHALAAVGALLPAWYFSETAQKLYFDYFRDERLGIRLTVSARFDFLSGLFWLIASTILLIIGAFFAVAWLGFRPGMALILSALAAGLCHALLPWAFVLSPDSHRRGRRLLTYDEAQAIAQKNLSADDPGCFWGGI